MPSQRTAIPANIFYIPFSERLFRDLDYGENSATLRDTVIRYLQEVTTIVNHPRLINTSAHPHVWGNVGSARSGSPDIGGAPYTELGCGLTFRRAQAQQSSDVVRLLAKSEFLSNPNCSSSVRIM
ncbi:hypothetical protein WISP_20107 [Willisornis vidua]|uniref:Uncharacterized protein n=1 Tax=Willisornis vidua TaxID=1566151 RepID=A0ABQ9DUI8_9PASS|nr:hypothetical protein WISP_20107 [Willisornis vidua]